MAFTQELKSRTKRDDELNERAFRELVGIISNEEDKFFINNKDKTFA